MNIFLSRRIKKVLIIYTIILLGTMFAAKVFYRRSKLFEAKIHRMQSEMNNLQKQLEISNAKIHRLQSSKRTNDATNDERTVINSVQWQPAYEKANRHLASLLQELGFFISATLKDLDDQFEHAESISRFAASVDDQIRNLIAVHRRIMEIDGYESLRVIESKQIGKLIDERFLENNLQCQKRVKCSLSKACGFGCQLHHLTYCSIFAYHTGRKLVIDSDKWSYGNGAFNSIFEPLQGSVCSDDFEYSKWNGDLSVDGILLPIIDNISPTVDFLPLAIPGELVRQTKILSLHGNPFVLFAGHLMKHLIKLKPEVKKILDERRMQINPSRPIVGVHVRRTDKIGTEAAYHHLDEYMKHVEEYFDIEERKQGRLLQRRVFIASDEPNILKEAEGKYSNYEFIFNKDSAKSGSVHRRYKKTSIINLILDMILLSECDFLVCTFSSQVCRVAYEILQTRYVDGSWRFRSLDDIYYFGGQLAHDYQATMNHTANNKDEISLIEGDLLGMAGNHWNGYCKAKNRRTNKEGLFPSYKANDVVRIYG